MDPEFTQTTSLERKTVNITQHNDMCWVYASIFKHKNMMLTDRIGHVEIFLRFVRIPNK